MLKKSEVASLLRNFCAMSDRQFGQKVKAIRTDNGTEFMTLSSYFRETQYRTSDFLHIYAATKRSSGKKTQTYFECGPRLSVPV